MVRFGQPSAVSMFGEQINGEMRGLRRAHPVSSGQQAPPQSALQNSVKRVAVQRLGAGNRLLASFDYGVGSSFQPCEVNAHHGSIWMGPQHRRFGQHGSSGFGVSLVEVHARGLQMEPSNSRFIHRLGLVQQCIDFMLNPPLAHADIGPQNGHQ